MLRDVLSAPLMVALARTAYSDTSASPEELLKDGSFRKREDVEDHLLDQFVTAVYRTPPSSYITPTDRWSADEARGWLSSLARRLQRLGLREIVWWRLSPGVPEACRLGLETAALLRPATRPIPGATAPAELRTRTRPSHPNPRRRRPPRRRRRRNLCRRS
jgi:hypothetical protein